MYPSRTTTNSTWLSTTLVLTVFLLAGTLPSTAQVADDGVELRPGLKGGLTSMTQGGDGSPSDLDRRTGFHVGAFALIDYPGMLSVRPEVSYIQKGASVSDTFLPILDPDVPEVEVTSDRRLDYIELPVLVRASLPFSAAVDGNVFAGPMVAVNVLAEADVEVEGERETIDISDATETIEAGLVLGAGLDVNIGSRLGTVDVRYVFGLTDTADQTDLQVVNQGFTVGLGIAL